VAQSSHDQGSRGTASSLPVRCEDILDLSDVVALVQVGPGTTDPLLSRLAKKVAVAAPGDDPDALPQLTPDVSRFLGKFLTPRPFRWRMRLWSIAFSRLEAALLNCPDWHLVGGCPADAVAGCTNPRTIVGLARSEGSAGP